MFPMFPKIRFVWKEGKNAVLWYALTFIAGGLVLYFRWDHGGVLNKTVLATLMVFDLWRIVQIGRGKKWE